MDQNVKAIHTARDIAERAVIESSHQSLKAVLMRGEHIISEVDLPDYGETKIVTHRSKVTFVEKATKEQVE